MHSSRGTLEGRLAWRKATIEAISASKLEGSGNQLPPQKRQTYAEILLSKPQQPTGVKRQDKNEVSQKPTFMATSTTNTQISQNTTQTRKEVKILHQKDNQKSQNDWIVVNKKRKVKSAHRLFTKRHPELQKQKMILMAEKRCFKCFFKGHKSSECRDIIRCIKCRKFGHTAGRCTLKRNSDRSSIKLPFQNTFQHNPSENQIPQIQKFSMQTQITEWETMDLIPPTLVEGRPDITRVYLPPKPRNASYGVLDYSAVVLAGPHHADPYLSQRVAAALAGLFDLHPRDFRITAPDDTICDRLVEFPDIDLCRRAVREGFLLLANGAEVQLKKWAPDLGMVRHPMPYRARVKLLGVPIYNRNEREINHLIAGIGYVQSMTPVYVDGRFESLLVLIACHHPKNIPLELLMTTDPYSKLVTIQLEGFINIEDEPLPLLSPDNPLPPPEIWRPRAAQRDDHELRPAHRREGTNRRHRHEGFANSEFRHRERFGQIWQRKEVLETVMKSNGEVVPPDLTPPVILINREKGSSFPHAKNALQVLPIGGKREISGQKKITLKYTLTEALTVDLRCINGDGTTTDLIFKFAAGPKFQSPGYFGFEGMKRGRKKEIKRVINRLSAHTNLFPKISLPTLSLQPDPKENQLAIQPSPNTFNPQPSPNYFNPQPGPNQQPIAKVLQLLQPSPNPSPIILIHSPVRSSTLLQPNLQCLLQLNKSIPAAQSETSTAQFESPTIQSKTHQLIHKTKTQITCLDSGEDHTQPATKFGLPQTGKKGKLIHEEATDTALHKIDMFHMEAGDRSQIEPQAEEGEQFQAESSSPLLEGPPPGFEKIPITKRRSSRLRAKEGTCYMSAIDKAKATQGYTEVKETPTKVKTKRSKLKETAKLTYLQSYEPLSGLQAGLVAAMAGVVMDPVLQHSIDQVLTRSEPTTPMHD